MRKNKILWKILSLQDNLRQAEQSFVPSLNCSTCADILVFTQQSREQGGEGQKASCRAVCDWMPPCRSWRTQPGGNPGVRIMPTPSPGAARAGGTPCPRAVSHGHTVSQGCVPELGVPGTLSAASLPSCPRLGGQSCLSRSYSQGQLLPCPCLDLTHLCCIMWRNLLPVALSWPAWFSSAAFHCGILPELNRVWCSRAELFLRSRAAARRWGPPVGADRAESAGTRGVAWCFVSAGERGECFSERMGKGRCFCGKCRDGIAVTAQGNGLKSVLLLLKPFG